MNAARPPIVRADVVASGRRPRRNPWAVVLGSIVIALGVAVTAGGCWLMLLGGSFYYVLAGIGLLASGILTVSGRLEAGAWTYLALWLATLIWSYWEVGIDGWALLPRIVAPTVILVLLLSVTLLSVPSAARVRVWRGYGLATIVAVGLFGTATVLAGSAPVAFPPTHGSSVASEGLTSGDTQVAGRNWTAYGGSEHATRYSSLAQITPANAVNLRKVWTFRTGDMPSKAAKNKYSPENTPLAVNGRLFSCSAKNILIAIEGATGKEAWRYDPKVSDAAIPYGATCRGVAFYRVPNAEPGQPCSERILEGTLDARLIAVDALSGIPCPDFGRNGSVDLTEGIGETVPGWYAVTAPPAIVRGIAVVGAEVKDGQAEDAPSGVIRGYDANSGALAWAWDMGHPERTGAPPKGETYARGTPNMWTSAAADEELGLVFVPLGNSSVDYYGGNRKGFENEFSSSLVAIDVSTGKPAWHFQAVHYDLWDYDLGSQPTLVDLPTDKGVIPTVILASKQGQIYVLDRKTGKSLFAVEERRAPNGGVEPQALSKTQPYSHYAHLDQPPLVEKNMWGMSPIDQLWCRIRFRRASYAGEYTAPTVDRPYIEYPGYNGGSDWGSVAVDTRRGILIANYNDMPNHNRLIHRAEADRLGIRPINQGGTSANAEGEGDAQTGSPFAIHVNAGWRLPTGLLCKQPPYGRIRAIDLRTGKTLWERPLGSARNNGPFGIPSMLPLTIGTPNNGGPLITAGGLVFIAATTDDTFRAIDIETGRVVWQVQLPAGGQATPMTYEVNGRQFVVISPGGHHFMETKIGDYVIAYALPEQ